MVLLTINPPVIAHRGASREAPENTLLAFQKAKEHGARWLEFDVMLTACGRVVVFHDESLERTTNGSGKVNESTYDYIKTLDAGSWFDRRYHQARVPLLEEVLFFLEAAALMANIELKFFGGEERLLVAAVLKVIADCWPKKNPPLLFSSFSLEVLHELRRQAPNALLGLLMDDFLPDWQKQALALNCASIHINQQVMSVGTVQKLKMLNKPLFCYTVNDSSRAGELFSWGVDAVFSDQPGSLLQGLPAQES